MTISCDVLIIGAGGAGLMAAATAAERGQKTVLIDHAKKIGTKIRISGGGRCNFTNLHASAANYISQNPHFCKSALKQFTQWDFINLVEKHGIAYHEKKLGQLFCNESAQQIIDLLLDECKQAGAELRYPEVVQTLEQNGQLFAVKTDTEHYVAKSLIIATGGLSIPKSGASNVGYQIAKQFGHSIVPCEPALVPLTLSENDKAIYSPLSGASVDVSVSVDNTQFSENLLFTHRGLSGPAILQISSYWQAGKRLEFDLLTTKKINFDELKSNATVASVLRQVFPEKLAKVLAEQGQFPERVQKLSDAKQAEFLQQLKSWQIKPNGSEGYRTAEVTRGGVDTNEISSKTMESKKVSGLYFVGEVLDVTGWLGGYNFQWSWSSGYVAGKNA
jgi:hypothetical protein